MTGPLQALLLAGFRRLEAALDWAFTPEGNPLYQLGALSFLFFWIVAATGVYLFVFFDTSVTAAYASVQALTVEQWWLGGVMRSLHRYASAAMAVTVTLHLLREFALGRFRGARAFSWISGVPLLWLLFASAIGGYVLVWDELAQYAAVATAEWLDWLPLFGDPLARNFFKPGTLSDRLFSLLVFLHIAIPLFLLAGMFIHIKRIKLARTNPERGLLTGTCLALLIASLVHPATSMAPADLTREPVLVDLDWIYMNAYPLLDGAGPAAMWAVLGGVTLLLILLPRLPAGALSRAQTIPTRRSGLQTANHSPPGRPFAVWRPLLRESSSALVDPANCNGCSWCFQDCPFEAITMVAHESKDGMRQARVHPDLCTGCGICVGACPSATPFRRVEELVSGIEIPGYPLDRLRADTRERLAQLPEEGGLMVFGCDHAADVAGLDDGMAALSLPCIALLPPSFVDWVSRQEQVKEVVITGCHPADCFQRKGSEWMTQRLAGEREPHLRTSRGRDKVTVHWAGPRETKALQRFLAARAGAGDHSNGTGLAESGASS